MGTFYGPVVGALIVVAMQNDLAQFGERVTVIQGVAFVACAGVPARDRRGTGGAGAGVPGASPFPLAGEVTRPRGRGMWRGSRMRA